MPACDPGTYTDGNFTSKDDCIDCQKGYECPGGAARPKLCRPGSNAPIEGAAECELCDGGTYQNETGAVNCKLCAQGNYCPEGASAPLVCQKGTYGDATYLAAATDCTPCPEGSSCPTGSATPALCDAGSYAPAESAVCSRCAAGRFQGQAGQAGCVECPPGSSCAEGATAPSACAPGSVANASGSASCSPCAGGSYQPAANETACNQCTPGSYCPLGASAPLPCSKGTYSSATDLSAKMQCVPCPVGSSCSTGSVAPTPCAPGSVANPSGSSECSPCAGGSYQPSLNATACLPCEAGSACPEGAAAPRPCEAGSYSNATDLSDVQQCAACPQVNFFHVHKSLVWLPLTTPYCATQGRFCSTASVKPLLCSPGNHAPRERMALCEPCEAGLFQPDWGKSSCDGRAWVLQTAGVVQKNITLLNMPSEHYNETLVRQQLAQEYGVALEMISLEMSPGSVQLTVTISAPPASTGSENATAALESIIVAVAAVNDSALSSALEANVVSTPPIQSQVEVLIEAPASCEPGSYCPPGASSPVPCPAGTRQNHSVLVMTYIEDCVDCSAGTACPVGSVVETDCSVGTFNNQTNQKTCHKCEAGSYQDEEGKTACKRCTSGFYCEEGASAPVPCPGGTYKNLSLDVMTSVEQCVRCPEGSFCSVGSAAPTLCAPGTFNPYTNATTCPPCRWGTFQSASGETACQECEAGHYCPRGSSTPLRTPPAIRTMPQIVAWWHWLQLRSAPFACSMPCWDLRRRHRHEQRDRVPQLHARPLLYSWLPSAVAM